MNTEKIICLVTSIIFAASWTFIGDQTQINIFVAAGLVILSTIEV